jgi:hypothetical protein
MRIATIESSDAAPSLNDGDGMFCELEKIGTLRNRVRSAA